MAKNAAKSFLVIGLGTFGHQAAVALAQGGATVIAVDTRRERVEGVAHLVAKAAATDGSSEESLEALGAFDVDAAIVSVGDFFAVTVLVTHLLRKRKVPQVVVQVNSQREAEAIRAVGATLTCFPERDSARTIVGHFLEDPVPYERIAIGHDAGIIEIAVPAAMVGKTLLELDVRRRHSVNVVAIKTPPTEEGLSEQVLVIPDARSPLVAGQVLVVLGHNRHIGAFHKAFAVPG
ncbi:MAG: TrkA family potassium uptake protein [Planctomycetes bacterium]|nr:TrkA family potassium uptake protein [Planctomycetota bacterium]